MIKWFKRNQNSEPNLDTEEHQDHAESSMESRLEEPQELTVKEPSPKESIFARFRKGLSKTRHQLGEGISRLLLGKKEISQELLEELETLLISADLGLDTTQDVLKQLNEGLARKQLSNGEAVYQTLKTNLQTILSQEEKPLSIETEDGSPFVILMVGVNGAGKTTTIGKLAKQFQKQGKKSC